MTNNPVLIAVLALAELGVLSIWASGARAQRKLTRRLREVTRTGNIALRATLIGLALAAVQWGVLAGTTSGSVWALTLGVPGLLAGTTIARLFAVTTVVRAGRQGGARR